MGKPSIFSKEYDRHRKRRKKIIAIFVVLTLVAAGIFLASGSIKSLMANKVRDYKNIKLFSVFKKEKKDETAQSNLQNKSVAEVPSNNETPEVKVEEKGYDISLSNGNKIRAVYETIDGVNKFKYILPINTSVSFNINPSGSAMVVFDSEVQNMLLVDISGNVQDITKIKYIYSKDDKKTVFNKEEVLNKFKKNNYVWCSSPKFIDDENIAYLSQLPHISSKVSTKFFWSVNIKNKDSHIYKYSLKGESLKLGNTNDKGIELVMDNGTIKYVKMIEGDIKVSE